MLLELRQQVRVAGGAKRRHFAEDSLVEQRRDRVPGRAQLRAYRSRHPDLAQSPDGGGANPVSGYGMFEASDVNEAIAKAKGCPILTAGGSVELAEIVDM